MNQITAAVQLAYEHKQSGVFDDNAICMVRDNMRRHILTLDQISNPDTRLEGEFVIEMAKRIAKRFEDEVISRGAVINFRGMLIQATNLLGEITKANEGHRSIEFLFTGVDSGRFYKALVQAAQIAQNEQD